MTKEQSSEMVRCLPVTERLFAYFLEDDGDRNGLNGGNRENGGPSDVDNTWRDNANENLSVRFVLSRNILIVNF